MDYKAYALMAILLASVASVALVGAAYAQTTSLTVTTDKTSYNSGDEVTVTGKLNATAINQPLLIQVFDPDGNFVKNDQFDPAADGSYSYKFKTGGPLMAKTGTYKVAVSYKGTVKKEATFAFTAGEGAGFKTFNLKVGDKTYSIQYKITGGTVQNMVADTPTSTLNVTISSTADGNLLIKLPRNVIDMRTQKDANGDLRAGADGTFEVFADTENIGANETQTTVDQRTLSIDFAQGTETIEIVGSYAIPEFGAIAAIILAVAIVGIIVATARYGKFNFAPRL